MATETIKKKQENRKHGKHTLLIFPFLVNN